MTSQDNLRMRVLDTHRVHMLAPKTLLRDPTQPRKSFDAAGLKELAASIAALGVLQPLVVRGQGKKTYLVAGERRRRASIMAKLKLVPCIYSTGDRVHRAAIQISENVQREALNPIDIAAFLVRLQADEKKSVNELVGALAKHGIKEVSHARVEKLLRMDSFPEWVKKHMRAGELNELHGVHLLPWLEFPAVMKDLQAEVRRQLTWTGAVTVKDLQREIETSCRHVGRNLKSDWGQFARRFDLKLCQGCEFKKQIGGGTYCLNRAEFDKKNLQAAELEQAKQEKKRKRDTAAIAAGTPTVSAREKLKRRGEVVQLKVEDYLDPWLRPRVLAVVAERATPMQVYGLTYWLATGRIEKAEWYGSGQDGRRLEEATRGILWQHQLGNLAAVMDYAMDPKAKAHREQAIARAAVAAMSKQQLRWFARAQLKFDLLKEGYKVDLAYLDLLQKRELIQLAELGGVKPRGAGGVAQLKRDILDSEGSVARIGVPKVMADLYAQELPAPPKSTWKQKQPTSHDQLLHELGLDSSAGADDIVHALHVQAEEQAAKLKAEADKATAAREKKRTAKKGTSKKAASKKTAAKGSKKNAAKRPAKKKRAKRARKAA